MVRNYLKTAWRSLLRSKAFSFINIFGLGLGIACSLLIYLWVTDELSVDAFHSNKSNIYAVYERVFSEGKPDAGYYTAGSLATELKRKIPEVQYAAAFDERMSGTFMVGEKSITMKGGSADSDFFKIFSYKLLKGTAITALNRPDGIAVSRRMADNFFGSPNAAFNKTIRLDNKKDFLITAVFEDVKDNSSSQFDYLLNWQYHFKDVGWLSDWVYRGPKTYVALYPGTSQAVVEAKIKNFIDPYFAKDKESNGLHYELGLQRFDQAYLHSTFKNGVPEGGRIEYVYLFSIVGVFILLIACINFMNLSTARSVKRAKEVGIRKAAGALRSWLIFQFIGEAMLFTVLAITLALVIAVFLLPYFNTVTGKQIVLPVKQFSFWMSLAGLTLIIGLVAGSYPALFLSALNPVKVLKGPLKFNAGAVWFRKGLVVFQFALSIMLIIGTLVIAKQINFIQTRNLGFDKENLIYVPLSGNITSGYDVFKQEITGMPGIKAVSRADFQPTQINGHAYDVDWAGKNPNSKIVVIHTTVGYDYLKTLNLKLLQGRDFSKDLQSDSTTYIINETALKLTGYKDPIGKPISIFQIKGKIVGVVKDFHFKSLHDPIEPLLVNLDDKLQRGGYALVRTRPGETKEAIASLQTVYKQLESRFPFSYVFADQQFQRLYQNEQIISRLSNTFASLAIFISCMGLLGLAMFTAEQRAKEIGVRKVLGASEAVIFKLLSAEFLQLVVIAFFIAAPLAWLVMSNWLRNYAYRTNIGIGLFAFAGVAALAIAMLTISYQAIKAAIVNPVKSLRSE